MNTETLIKVEGVSKKFCCDLKKSLWYGMKDLGSELLGRSKRNSQLRSDEFWAVKDVSFELKRGECLGLIGHNGAGKSTLLKILSGLIKPDQGKISIKGRVGALIELNAGFNPILTGRENVYVYGSILGLTTKDIDDKYDAIVEFAEINDFMEMPLQSYSSGMKVRLGFAVAAQMEPDVLIIDEVLSVGDMEFRAKCFNAIYKIMQTSAVIFVTHAMPQVSRVCSSLIVLAKGTASYQGRDIARGIDSYYTSFQPDKCALVTGSGGKAAIQKIELKSCGKNNVSEINFGDELSVNLECLIDKEVAEPNVSLTIVTQELLEVIQSSSYYNKTKLRNTSGKIILEINLGHIFLNPASYSICVTIMSERHGEVIYKCPNLCHFRVKGDFVGHSPVQIPGNWQVTQT
jgi:lipopolysaccharide transport system ATP-binding protein